MKVKDAKAAAIDWVLQHASREAWFRGAYFAGSAVGLHEDAELPQSSDIDVVVVMDQEEPPLKLGKFHYRDTLLEITYLPSKLLASAEELLTSYHLAGSFRVNTIIDDPTGHLRKMQSEVSRHFADYTWVRHRCENVMKKIEDGLRSIDTSAPLHDLVQSWLFPTGITTHVILVAALRNPTVRKRYVAAREVLIDYGYSELYEELLQQLGCAHLPPERVEHHLTELTRTFDTAAAIAKTPFFFSTDISPISRPIVIDGSRELIEAGLHRETVFWIVATFARCHKIFATDAPRELQQHLPAFESIIADLGLTSTDAILKRAEKTIEFLPKLWEVAEMIMRDNPNISLK